MASGERRLYGEDHGLPLYLAKVTLVHMSSFMVPLYFELGALCGSCLSDEIHWLLHIIQGDFFDWSVGWLTKKLILRNPRYFCLCYRNKHK